jgi:hypothetical protein
MTARSGDAARLRRGLESFDSRAVLGAQTHAAAIDGDDDRICRRLTGFSSLQHTRWRDATRVDTRHVPVATSSDPRK